MLYIVYHIILICVCPFEFKNALYCVLFLYILTQVKKCAVVEVSRPESILTFCQKCYFLSACANFQDYLVDFYLRVPISEVIW